MALLRSLLALLLLPALNEAIAIRGAQVPHSNSVQRVVDLLTELRTKLEGEAEKRLIEHTAFTGKANDTQAELRSSIAEAQADAESAERKIGELETAISDHERDIKALEEEIVLQTKAIQQLQKDREASLAAYSEDASDLSSALRGLEKAISALKASRTVRDNEVVSQLQVLRPVLLQALATAQALGIAPPKAKAALAFLQQEPVDLGLRARRRALQVQVHGHHHDPGGPSRHLSGSPSPARPGGGPRQEGVQHGEGQRGTRQAAG